MNQTSLNIPLLQEQIQQLKRLDGLIAQHQKHGGTAAEFISSQYQHRKEQLLKELVVELAAHDFEDRLHEQMHLLRLVLVRFVTSEHMEESRPQEQDELRELKALLDG